MPEPAQKFSELTDFPDRFSPMLVKELRQGLRTNLFVTSFILLQGFMILCILMSWTESNSTSTASGFFWFFIVVSLVVVQPLRGFAALSNEYQLNTMDLIQMTRLDAWRIVWGKWCAINAQTLLLVAAITPYLVLRYFFGSINIFIELGLLALLALSSALLSAMTVGCSALKNLIARITALVACGVLFVFLFGYTVNEIFRGSFTSAKMQELGLVILACFYGTYFFLAFGASRIAPGSENHTTKKRLIGLAFAFAAWAAQFLGFDDEVCHVVASLILGLTLIDAITEQPPVFEAVLKPFSSPLKKPLAYFLTPGWHTGVLFFSLLCILWLLGLLNHYHFKPETSEMGVMIYGAGMLTFPLIIIHLFFKKSSMPHFALYLFIQACLVIVTILAIAVAENTSASHDLVYMCIPLPSVLFFGNLDGNVNEPIFLFFGIFWLAISILLPLFYGLKLYRKMGETFKAFNS